MFTSPLPLEPGALPAGAPPDWPRRSWLQYNATLVLAAHSLHHVPHGALGRSWRVPRAGRSRIAPHVRVQLAAQAERVDPAEREALAHRAVEVAHAAGAAYADARLTRTVQHTYFPNGPASLISDVELLGLGVRALVNGYWGFSASPTWTPAEAERLAQDAVAQAKINARGKPRTVDLGTVPAVTGRWATPVQIDPFTVSIEEKSDTIDYWNEYASRLNLQPKPALEFARQEQTVATSEGTLISQTLYQSGGGFTVQWNSAIEALTGLEAAGKGWEHILAANVPDQLVQLAERMPALDNIPIRPATVGRYTLVCTGNVMACLVERTFGLATQLDRALGYEANATGTSYLDDPLGMVGHAQVAPPIVTLTANRSAPGQLATVKWDAEGVVPQDTTLIKDGVLVDYQTTREQAAWLAPYYQKIGKPVRSHGYAAAEDALYIAMQHMPNLALVPTRSAVRLEDLVANVADGILMSSVEGIHMDQQARNGYFWGRMRQIKNGRLEADLSGGAILFNTEDLWKHVTALGGLATEGEYAFTAISAKDDLDALLGGLAKGQPPQLASHTARAPAATIAGQALINLARKG